MRLLRDAWVVASFDLAESLRSRKVLVVLVLYVLGAIASTAIFAEVLSSVEQELAERLLVARTDTPGSLTQAVMESPELLRILTRLVRDRDLAESLVTIPPVALLYGWVTLAFAPLFVVLTASDSVSTEVSTGSVRFALARTDRASWALGKLLGQTSLLAFGVAVGGVAAWATGALLLASSSALDSALWIARYGASAFFFAFAHLGLALGVSQATRSVPWSRALGLVGLALVFGLHGWLGRDSVRDRAPVLVDSVRQVFPAAHRLDLWRPDVVDVLPAAAMLLALGLCYFFLGYARFARRDA